MLYYKRDISWAFNNGQTTFVLKAHCGITHGDDRRLLELCKDPVDRTEGSRLYTKTECKSPYGVYDLKIPVDRRTWNVAAL